MKKKRAAELWEEAQDNARRLHTCFGPHDFVPGRPRYANIPHGPRQYACTKCGGEIDSHAHHWYQEGVIHGKNPGG